jgi:hypothetical protein
VVFAGAGLLALAVYAVGVLVVAPAEVVRLLVPGAFLILATHAVSESRGRWLDRLVYGRVAGELRALADRAAVQPDPITVLADAQEAVDALLHASADDTAPPSLSADDPADAPASAATPAPTTAAGELAITMRVETETALRRLTDLAALSEHPLLDRLPWIAGAPGTRLDRARLLRDDLIAAIRALAPPGERPLGATHAAAQGWLPHDILHDAYVKGVQNKTIIRTYASSEGTFNRTRRRAIDAIAASLADRVAGTIAAGTAA